MLLIGLSKFAQIVAVRFLNHSPFMIHPICLMLEETSFNPNEPGGGGGLDIFRDKSAARIGLAARFHEFFPYRFAHILRPNLWRPGVRWQNFRNF